MKLYDLDFTDDILPYLTKLQRLQWTADLLLKQLAKKRQEDWPVATSI